MKHSALQVESEPAIPDDNAPLPPARPGTRWTVRRGRAIASVLLGLALAVSLLSVYATYQAAAESGAASAAVDRRLTVLEQDLAERRKQRDQENAEVRAYLCSVLDQLPAATPSLNELRAALQCTEPGTAPAPAPSAPAAARPPGEAPAQPAPPPPARAQAPVEPAVPALPLPAPPRTEPSTAAPPAAPPSPAAPAPAPPAPPARGLLGDLICALPLLC